MLWWTACCPGHSVLQTGPAHRPGTTPGTRGPSAVSSCPHTHRSLSLPCLSPCPSPPPLWLSSDLAASFQGHSSYLLAPLVHLCPLRPNPLCSMSCILCKPFMCHCQPLRGAQAPRFCPLLLLPSPHSEFSNSDGQGARQGLKQVDRGVWDTGQQQRLGGACQAGMNAALGLPASPPWSVPHCWSFQHARLPCHLCCHTGPSLGRGRPGCNALLSPS